MNAIPGPSRSQPSSDTLSRILDLAVNAPSGDNSQPWEFKITNGAIEVFLVENADATLYDFKSRGSYLAHGALIENVVVAASALGWHAEIEYLPGPDRETARVHFKAAAVTAADQKLADALPHRHTNRTAYALRPLATADQAALIEAATQQEGGRLSIVGTKAQIKALSDEASVNERVLMANQGLHDGLFSMIRFTRKEEEARPGLYIKTMSLPAPMEFLFRHVLRSWRMTKLLSHTGFPRLAAFGSGAGYRAASAFGAVIVRGSDPIDFIRAGRIVERVWLTATERGVSLQPITAIPYLAARITEKGGGEFSAQHTKLILEADAAMREVFSVSPDERIAMLFRLGYGRRSRAVSAKRPPKVLA